MKEKIRCEEDTRRRFRVVCPHCGHVHEDSFDFTESGEQNCEDCNAVFDLEIDIEPKYTTTKR